VSCAAGSSLLRLRHTAHGTTDSESRGAATMPSATTDCPEKIPTATTSANMKREIASMNTSPP